MTRLQQLSRTLIDAKKNRERLYVEFCRAEDVCPKLQNEVMFAMQWADVKHEHKIAALNLSDEVISEIHDWTIRDGDHDAILKKHGMLGSNKQPTALYNASLFVFMYGRKWCMDLME